MSTAKFNQWQNPDGSENYKCRAWVNFNGTGTVAIRASGNVSSITDNGTGQYTVNFTTAMQDANYDVVLGSVAQTLSDGRGHIALRGAAATGASTRTTTAIGVTSWYASTPSDNADLNVSIFR